MVEDLHPLPFLTRACCVFAVVEAVPQRVIVIIPPAFRASFHNLIREIQLAKQLCKTRI